MTFTLCCQLFSSHSTTALSICQSRPPFRLHQNPLSLTFDADFCFHSLSPTYLASPVCRSPFCYFFPPYMKDRLPTFLRFFWEWGFGEEYDSALALVVSFFPLRDSETFFEAEGSAIFFFPLPVAASSLPCDAFYVRPNGTRFPLFSFPPLRFFFLSPPFPSWQRARCLSSESMSRGHPPLSQARRATASGRSTFFRPTFFGGNRSLSFPPRSQAGPFLSFMYRLRLVPSLQARAILATPVVTFFLCTFFFRRRSPFSNQVFE